MTRREVLAFAALASSVVLFPETVFAEDGRSGIDARPLAPKEPFDFVSCENEKLIGGPTREPDDVPVALRKLSPEELEALSTFPGGYFFESKEAEIRIAVEERVLELKGER